MPDSHAMLVLYDSVELVMEMRSTSKEEVMEILFNSKRLFNQRPQCFLLSLLLMVTVRCVRDFMYSARFGWNRDDISMSRTFCKQTGTLPIEIRSL